MMIRKQMKNRKVRVCYSGSLFCDNNILLVKMIGHLLNATIVNLSFILGLSVLSDTDLYRCSCFKFELELHVSC